MFTDTGEQSRNDVNVHSGSVALGNHIVRFFYGLYFHVKNAFVGVTEKNINPNILNNLQCQVIPQGVYLSADIIYLIFQQDFYLCI